MWTFIEQARDVGQNRRTIEHLQEHRVVVQDVKDARVIPLNMGHTGVGDVAFLKLPPLRNKPMESLQKLRDMVFFQQPFQDQVTVVVEEESICLRGFGFVCYLGVFPFKYRSDVSFFNPPQFHQRFERGRLF